MSATHNSMPAEDGFRMPAEFEPHAGCWMLWPERTDVWRSGAEPAREAFVNVAKVIAESEPVTVGVSTRQFVHACNMLPSSVRVVEMSSNDAWMRDCGPTFVVNTHGDVRGVDWKFNAWGGLNGGLYFPWDQDDLVARKVLEIERMSRYEASLVLEGGSIHVDGEGTLITTKECLLNTNRNPGLSQSEIEECLKSYLNIGKIIWLDQGIVNDETDGHVDNLCCFTEPGVVAVTWCDETDPQYEISRDAYDRLSNAKDAKGRKLKVAKIIHPSPQFRTEEEAKELDTFSEQAWPRKSGERLAASYVNFYIGNRVVAIPFIDEQTDALARKQIQTLFPNRKVVGIPARELFLGGGGIHCITQQQPLGNTKLD